MTNSEAPASIASKSAILPAVRIGSAAILHTVQMRYNVGMQSMTVHNVQMGQETSIVN